MPTPIIAPGRLIELQMERAEMASRAHVEAASVLVRIETAEDCGAKLAAETLSYAEIQSVASAPLNCNGMLTFHLKPHMPVIDAALGAYAFEDSRTQYAFQRGVRRVLDQVTKGT